MIIAFTGKKQSGKSTACAYIKDAVRANFKDALIAEIKDNFPRLLDEISTIMEQHYWDGKRWTMDRLFSEKPPLMRALLQNYGTEVRRKDHPEYWVNKWKDAVGESTAVDIVCDDVRFLNEAEAVRSVGGIVVRIVREDLPTNDTHSSETEMDLIKADYTISVKTGEYTKLYEQIDQILRGAKGKTQ